MGNLGNGVEHTSAQFFGCVIHIYAKLDVIWPIGRGEPGLEENLDGTNDVPKIPGSESKLESSTLFLTSASKVGRREGSQNLRKFLDNFAGVGK